MKLGIYGGTFDPIHIAHLIIAEAARCDLDLDRVIFMPSFIPPHKPNRRISPAHIRLKMLRSAVADHPAFEVSDYEILKQGISYTVDTVRHFSSLYHIERNHLFLIVGQDNLADFDLWKNPEEIVRMASLAVAARPDQPMKMPALLSDASIHYLSSPHMSISSSMVRERVMRGQSIRYLVPPNVEKIIEEKSLYLES